MGVIITGRIADSAGMYEAGRIEFSQAQRVDTGELLVTQSVAVAQVVQGELRTLTGAVFSLPVNPAGTAVRVREVLGGRTFEWWTAVPDVESIEYRELPIIESAGVPESVWGPPPWIAQVEQMRDETIQAVADGTAVAEALGGLAGITQAVTEAETARDGAASAAGVAQAEADRAEAAAASVDMAAINARLDGMQGLAEGAVQRPVPAPADGTLLVYDAAAGRYAPAVLGVGLRVAGGEVRLAPADLVSKLRYPLYIAHRGAMGCYPEHSWEGYRASFEAGFSPEADVRALADGTLVCVHDATTTRTMSISKSVSTVTVAEWRKARVKPPAQADRIVGSGWGTPVFFEDYLDEFGGRCVLWPEIKISGAAATRAIKAIVDRGLQRSVVVQSAILSVCQEAVAAGCSALLLTNTVSPATMVSAGVEFVGVSGAASTDYITSCKAAGLRVIGFTHNTQAAADAEIARGCDGIFSDDPWEASREYVPRDVLDVSSGFLPVASAHSRGNSGVANPGQQTQGVAVENGALRFFGGSGTGYPNSLRLGQFGFGIDSRVLVRLTAQAIEPWPDSPTPETTWLVGIYYGRQLGDAAVNEEPLESQFRLAMVRRNGQKNAYEKRALDSAVTPLMNGSAPSTPYAKPGGRSVPMRFEVEFTPTSVRISNLTLNDTDLVATGAALTIPGAYLSLCVTGAVGRVWDVSVKKG